MLSINRFPHGRILCFVLFIVLGGMAGGADCQSPVPAGEIKLVVWLKTDRGLEGVKVICFSESIRLHKPQHVLVNTVTYGPIGVKDVVDALRIAADEPPCSESENLGQISGLLLMNPDDILHLLWEPQVPTYSFFVELNDGMRFDCDELPDAPDFFGSPELLLPLELGMGQSLRIIRRSTGGQAPITLDVALTGGCVN